MHIILNSTFFFFFFWEGGGGRKRLRPTYEIILTNLAFQLLSFERGNSLYGGSETLNLLSCFSSFDILILQVILLVKLSLKNIRYASTMRKELQKYNRAHN
jgi:hypothetical protein